MTGLARWTLILLAVNLVLGLLAWQAWTAPASQFKAQVGVAKESATGAASMPKGPSLPPLAQLAEVTQRPLFTPSRRPADSGGPGPAGGAAAENPGNFLLIGLYDQGAGRKALIRSGTEEAQSLGVNDSLAGWTVREINADHVVMTRGDDRFSLTFPVPRRITTPPRPNRPPQESDVPAAQMQLKPGTKNGN